MLRSVTTLPRLPLRPKDGHKGTFGRVLIVAGSTGMSGAAILAGLGALRGGAGLVHVACPLPILPIVAAGHPCYLTTGLPVDSEGLFLPSAHEKLASLLESCKAVAIGPGLGRNTSVTLLLEHLLNSFEGPFIIDADGLYAFKQLLDAGRVRERRLPLTITPHPGELSHLLSIDTKVIQSERKIQAVRIASEHKVIAVLKGQGTIVTDGNRVYVNTTGNPGMAKGGSGDILTGLIAALAAQGMQPLEASFVGVYLHGLAGDIAASVQGEFAMLPTDLVDALPAAFRKYVPST